MLFDLDIDWMSSWNNIIILTKIIVNTIKTEIMILIDN